jgi:hypothetical protein
MHKNHVTWSRKPSSENVSEVFIYSSYDNMEDDERLLMPKMLDVYSETVDAINKYENRKRIFFILGVLIVLGSWFYLATVSNL